MQTGVKAEQTELETDRQRDAVHMYGNSFDLITVEGKLQVANGKAEPITVEITKHLSGELKATTPEAKVQQLARGLRRMNPSQVLSWTFELKPGEKKELGYTYTALIAR